MTGYTRPRSKVALSKKQKLDLLEQYFEFYQRSANLNRDSLNVKVPRDAHVDLLNQIGNLLTSSAKAATKSGRIQNFLNSNPLPDALKGLLPDEFRAFCLALNALKQWVAAKQAAADRYLLGGTAKQLCRAVAKSCLVTNQSFDGQEVELHHPVRDGRPPIPLSKEGHAQIEGQLAGQDADPHLHALRVLKRNGNRSWTQLAIGCRALLGHEIASTSASTLSSAKTFARKAADLTGMNYQQLIEWLETNGL